MSGSEMKNIIESDKSSYDHHCKISGTCSVTFISEYGVIYTIIVIYTHQISEYFFDIEIGTRYTNHSPCLIKLKNRPS